MTCRNRLKSQFRGILGFVRVLSPYAFVTRARPSTHTRMPRRANSTLAHPHASHRPQQWHGGPITCACTMVIPSRRSGRRCSHSIRKTGMLCCQSGYAFRLTFPPTPADAERTSMIPVRTRESARSPTQRNCVLPLRIERDHRQLSPPGPASTTSTTEFRDRADCLPGQDGLLTTLCFGLPAPNQSTYCTT